MGNKKLLVIVCISLHILQASCRGIGVQVNNDGGWIDQGDRTPLQANGISRLTPRTFSDEELNTIKDIAQILHPILRGRRSVTSYLPYRGWLKTNSFQPRETRRVKPSAFFGPRDDVEASANSQGQSAIRVFRALYKDLLGSPKSYMFHKMV